ncbi:jg20877, partial [Pararge aegeria aegeria]
MRSDSVRILVNQAPTLSLQMIQRGNEHVVHSSPTHSFTANIFPELMWVSFHAHSSETNLLTELKTLDLGSKSSTKRLNRVRHNGGRCLQLPINWLKTIYSIIDHNRKTTHDRISLYHAQIVRYLLSSSIRSISDLMPMIGGRFYNK